jgi:hypothetical protein
MIRHMTLALGVISALAAAAPGAQAQDPPTCDVRAMVDALSAPAASEKVAEFYWSLYRALLDKGFTQDQAMQITAAQGSLLGACR